MLSEKIRSWRWWPAIPIALILGLALANAVHEYQPKHDSRIQAADQAALDVGSPNSSPQWVEAQATVTIARFTVVLAMVAIVGGALNWWQIHLARQSIALTRDEFMATHRPRITTRALRPSLSRVINGRYPVIFDFANEGETPAHIREIGTAVFTGPGPWNRGGREVRFEVEKIGAVVLSGQLYEIVTPETFSPIEDAGDRSAARGIFTYCVGYATYTDEIGKITRSTGFCRRWNFENMTWERTGYEQYEYAY